MTNKVYPLEIRDSDSDEKEAIEELSASETERARTLKSSLEWYTRQHERRGGWVSQIESCEESLAELGLKGAELEALETDPDRPGKSEREKEMEDLQETAEWMDERGWNSEHVWDELREMKEGKQG
jgi:hypothetical protein